MLNKSISSVHPKNKGLYSEIQSVSCQNKTRTKKEREMVMVALTCNPITHEAEGS
jgi:hypothetical protein